ncbi:MAG: hypothetical protein GTO18_05625 [Anaerolineales bacterium]|nr:hypothetical protein [Anaerolineales bacterium]
MVSDNENKGDSAFTILALAQGQWGERIAANIQQTAPPHWVIEIWHAPRVLPPIIDDPEDFLPESLPKASLVIALGETAGLAQLVPDAVSLCGAKAVIAPIDNNESLPPGLARQLEGWLEDMDVPSVFPKPFCSLTETTYNQKPRVISYDNEIIREFAHYFGRPSFSVSIEEGIISDVQVKRDSACGCAFAVAEGLPGTPVDDAVNRTGMLHHHFPCLASMNQDPDYHDTLMHVSGHILQDEIKREIEEYLSPTVYLRPEGRVEDSEE